MDKAKICLAGHACDDVAGLSLRIHHNRLDLHAHPRSKDPLEEQLETELGPIIISRFVTVACVLEWRKEVAETMEFHWQPYQTPEAKTNAMPFTPLYSYEDQNHELVVYTGGNCWRKEEITAKTRS